MTRPVEAPPSSTSSHIPDDERVAWGVLHAAGVSAAEVDRVVAVGGARAALAQGLARVGVGRAHAHDLARVERALARFVDEGGHILGGAARGELGRIVRAPSAPLVVYARGDASLHTWRAPTVAIVGTRHPTPAGLAIATELGRALAARGAHVVSGGAQGIDLGAHTGALMTGASTAVVGESLSSKSDPRPPRLRALFETGARALALTPFGPTHGDARGHFASRNRFVAGLADVVVVVEAGPRSGTLHTAEAAWRLGVPIVARALDDDDARHGGARALLAESIARPLVDVDDVLAIAERAHQASLVDASLVVERAPGQIAAAPSARRPSVFVRAPRAPRASRESLLLPFPPVESAERAPVVVESDDPVVRALASLGGSAERDALSRALSLDAAALAARLTVLELDGVVAREGALVVLRAR